MKNFNKTTPPHWHPTEDTLAYYPFEEDGNDYSGNGHHITWTSTPTYTTSGGTKNVVSLNGSTLGRIVTTPLTGTLTNYTIIVWCKSSNTTNTWQEIFDHQSGTSGDNIYFNWNGTAKELGGYNNFAYQYRPNGGQTAYQNIYPASSIIAGERHNVVVTSTSSGVKLYIDGVQVASNSTTGAIVLTGGSTAIGGRYPDGGTTAQNYFYGHLSEFILDGVTWNADQVLDYYNWTKSSYGYSPDSNTLFYIINNGEITDHSQYNHTMSWYGTEQYTTLQNGRKVAKCDGSSVIQSSTFTDANSVTTFTFHMWYRGSGNTYNYQQNLGGWLGRAASSTTTDRWGAKFQRDGQSNQNYVYVIYGGNSTNWQNNTSVNFVPTVDTFELFTFTINGKNVVVYKNATKIGEWSGSLNIVGGSNTGTMLYLGGLYDGSFVGSLPCEIGEVVLEKKVESQADVTAFYNMTKGKYGL